MAARSLRVGGVAVHCAKESYGANTCPQRTRHHAATCAASEMYETWCGHAGHIAPQTSSSGMPMSAFRRRETTWAGLPYGKLRLSTLHGIAETGLRAKIAYNLPRNAGITRLCRGEHFLRMARPAVVHHPCTLWGWSSASYPTKSQGGEDYHTLAKCVGHTRGYICGIYFKRHDHVVFKSYLEVFCHFDMLIIPKSHMPWV
jgi:hypothetical protein